MVILADTRRTALLIRKTALEKLTDEGGAKWVSPTLLKGEPTVGAKVSFEGRSVTILEEVCAWCLPAHVTGGFRCR